MTGFLDWKEYEFFWFMLYLRIHGKFFLSSTRIFGRHIKKVGWE